MPREKTKAILLKVVPYLESSCILHLFTEQHGLVHGIAKGVKNRKKSSEHCIMERGVMLELIIYSKAHRELNTLSSITVIDYYAKIRSNLIKTAIRDAAFETILTSITESDIHPELFELFSKFLQHINTAHIQECHPFALWLFYYRFLKIMGFSLNTISCISCNNLFTNTAFLIINKGGFECSLCCKNKRERYAIPLSVLSYLTKGVPKPLELREHLKTPALMNVTMLLAEYCRYHFEINNEYKSLIFLNEMTMW